MPLAQAPEPFPPRGRPGSQQSSTGLAGPPQVLTPTYRMDPPHSPKTESEPGQLRPERAQEIQSRTPDSLFLQPAILDTKGIHTHTRIHIQGRTPAGPALQRGVRTQLLSEPPHLSSQMTLKGPWSPNMGASLHHYWARGSPLVNGL